MLFHSRISFPVGTTLSILLLAPSLALADFAPGPNPISGNVTAAQTLSSGAGTVATNGVLAVSGSSVAITSSGTTALTNLGTVLQTGSGRALRNTAAGANLTVFIGSNALLSAVADDAVKTANSAISFVNFGTVSSTNGQGLDLRDITSAANSVVNHAGALIRATGEDAVRPGAAGLVDNRGTLQAIPVAGSGSDGVDAGARSGVTVLNQGLIEGRHGVTGGDTSYAILVVNQAGGTLRGVNGSGVNIDGLFATSTAVVSNFSGGLIEGKVDATSASGDGDGVDVDGVVALWNAGTIRAFGAKGVDSGSQSNNSEAVAIGGGTVINTASGQILGSTLSADAPTGDTSRFGRGILVDNGAGGSGLAPVLVDNAGLIQGRSGSAIVIAGAWTNTLINRTGGILRGTNGPAGAVAAVVLGDGRDVLTNSGAIFHDAGNGAVAIDAGGGDDLVVIEGGAASVQGGMDGGSGVNALRLNPGSGQSFSHAGAFTNFATLDAGSGASILGGAVTLSGNATVAPDAALRVNGAFTAAFLQSAGALGGTGTVNAVTALADGGKLAPGNSIGTMVFTTNLDLSAAVSNGVGSLVFELGAPGSNDMVVLTGGALAIGGGLLEFDDFAFTNAGWGVGTYTLFATPNAIEGTLGPGVSGTLGAYGATLGLGDSGTDLVLTVVPEPGAGALVILALAVAALLRGGGRARDVAASSLPRP